MNSYWHENHIKYRNLIFVFQREKSTNNITSLVTGDYILVKFWYYSPNDFHVNMSSIHIEIRIKVFIQKNWNINFGGTHISCVSKDLINRGHNESSPLIISVHLIVVITTMQALTFTQIHNNIFFICNFHFQKDRSNYENFQRCGKREKMIQQESFWFSFFFVKKLGTF